METNHTIYKACRIKGSPAEKLYLAMLMVSLQGAGEIQIARKQAAHILNLNTNTISRITGRLKRKGLIEIIPQYDEYGGRMPNSYRLK